MLLDTGLGFLVGFGGYFVDVGITVLRGGAVLVSRGLVPNTARAIVLKL